MVGFENQVLPDMDVEIFSPDVCVPNAEHEASIKPIYPADTCTAQQGNSILTTIPSSAHHS